jgi:hypothetical protein
MLNILLLPAVQVVALLVVAVQVDIEQLALFLFLKRPITQ